MQPVVSNSQLAARTRYTLNDGWRFTFSDQNKSEPAADDLAWTLVNLPHTWNAEDTLDDVPGYHRGTGWYRRSLRLDESLRGKRIFLYFEGANQVAEVFVNGRRVGTHIGGYTAFSFDVSDAVRFGAQDENTLVVSVDNSHNPNIPPLKADFNFYGGIYRDVWLIATDPVHFSMLDHAGPGVYVETPAVSAQSATTRVRGTIINDADAAQQIEVRSAIINAEGREVAVSSSALQLDGRTERTFELTPATITRPQLWSPNKPYLYSVRTVIRAGARTLDEVTTPLGFRWFSFDAERGFFLNGEHLKLRGTNRHQDFAGLGNAVPDALHIRDMEIIKDDGFNFVRLAHYPQDPSVLEAADRLGLIIWEEIPVVNQISLSDEFAENAKRMLTEMIRQHRNHPSIILWGYMNEVFLGPKMSDEHVRATVKLARALEEVCRREDPSRATTIAFDNGARELYHTSGLSAVTQVVGWNLYHGWYYDTFPDFGKFLDEEHRRFPRRPLIVSEYGANGDTRLHSLAPRRSDSTLEWQRMYHEAYLPQINARPFLAGAAVWNQFDFGSEFRGETIPHINQKGLYTFDRRPKDTSYFYRAEFSSKPVIHIATRDWAMRADTMSKQSNSTAVPEVTRQIDVYSNLRALELLCNGVSLGRRNVGDLRRVTWDVRFRAGRNVLVARGARDGEMFYDRAEINFTLTPPVLASAPFKELAVNVGSNAQFIGADKTVWREDQPYRAGGWGYLGEAKPVATQKNVWLTTEDPLYQTMLKELSGYRFDVPDGDYDVELRFVESEFDQAGKRIFDVSINGEAVIRRLDLAREYGLMKPFARRFHARVTDSKGLHIEFTPVVGPPILSAVRVRRLL